MLVLFEVVLGSGTLWKLIDDKIRSETWLLNQQDMSGDRGRLHVLVGKLGLLCVRKRILQRKYSVAEVSYLLRDRSTFSTLDGPVSLRRVLSGVGGRKLNL